MILNYRGPNPVCISNCADCGVGTWTIGEYYMVHDEVWEQAWAGRRKAWHGKVPGQEILCIGCLEARIGRTLTYGDFTTVYPSRKRTAREPLELGTP
jgi:hypothetical protein